MKNSGDGLLNVRQHLNLEDVPLGPSPLTETIRHLNEKAAPYIPSASSPIFVTLKKWFVLLQSLGVTAAMEDDERRKLKVFNLLNFFQFIFGIVIPITAILAKPKITTLGWIAACMPALVSLLVLFLNSRKQYEVSTLAYFILYPVITSIVYLSGMNLGIELFFILYGILAVFFIQDIGHMVFTVTLSMISYFVLTVVWRNFQFQLEVNGMLYLFNHLIAIVFIFFGLFFLKKENAGYQYSILNNNRILREKNTEIELQRTEIAEKVNLLDKQASELQELNTLKNRLFSVIAHDLKSPIYALKNIFANIQKYDVPAKEVKALVPEIMNDLNYTTSLLENLLQWAKCQMQSLHVTLEPINIASITDEVVQLLNSQAASKNICLVNTISEEYMVLGHRDMIRLVMRNLISNALKFTPREGYVTIGIEQDGETSEIYVLDTGVGITQEGVDNIHKNNFFTTEGTAAEKGTGLGLMLCKEFLAKNNSSLMISSDPGDGSRFAFRLRNRAE